MILSQPWIFVVFLGLTITTASEWVFAQSRERSKSERTPISEQNPDVQMEIPTGDDAVKIPLNQIWGYKISGTRGNLIGEILGDRSDWHRPLYHMRVPLPLGFPKHGKMPPGFAVIGCGADALIAAHSVLVNKEPKVDAFPEDTDVSLVFFSHRVPGFIRLFDVIQLANVIRVTYQFLPHGSDSDSSFAMIPLGKLPSGNYRVEFTRRPTDPRFVGGGYYDMSEEHQAICHPFDFTVTANKGGDK